MLLVALATLPAVLDANKFDSKSLGHHIAVGNEHQAFSRNVSLRLSSRKMGG